MKTNVKFNLINFSFKRFLPSLILVFCFCLYLIAMAIITRINNDASVWHATCLANAFCWRFSIINHLLLITISLIAIWNIYWFRKSINQFQHYDQYLENKKSIIASIISMIIAMLLITLIINISIVYANQNYYHFDRRTEELIIDQITSMQMGEFAYIYCLRMTFYLLLTIFVAHFINNKKTAIIILISYLAISLALVLIGMAITLIGNLTALFWVTLITGSIFPELINANFQWLGDFKGLEIWELIYNVDFINYIPYFISFVTLTILLSKIKWFPIDNKNFNKTKPQLKLLFNLNN